MALLSAPPFPQEDRSRRESRGTQSQRFTVGLPLPGPTLWPVGPECAPKLSCLQGSHSHPHLASAKEPLISPETTASGERCYQGGL